MSRFKVAKTSDIPPRQLHKVSVEQKEIVLVNIDDNFFAMDDTCTHAGASISKMGQLLHVIGMELNSIAKQAN
jgi:nitrite reductase/ring-hydroxylating ferredoxin subunit